jgi:hypothetical protein
VDRHSDRFAGEIPESDVDHPDRGRVDEALASMHGLPEGADLERIVAHQQRLQERDDLLADDGRAGAGSRQEVDALQALVGVNGQHAHRHRPV